MTEPLTDPCEMRKAMRMAAWRGLRIDGKPAIMPSPAANLARTAHHAAEHAGLSGEDEMTVLAYHALLALEQANDRELQHAMLDPTPPIIRTEEGARNCAAGPSAWNRQMMGLPPEYPQQTPRKD